jgi:LytS/YehU family sensor histidine kinase
MEPWQFVIRKAWWQLWWIWALVSVPVIAFLILIIRDRESRIRREAQRKVELADARARAIELEQKARQLQMRPHFISNALNAIQSNLINGDPERASEDLVRFSRMMRAMLNSSRKDRISLEDELDLLNEYVAVVGLAKGHTTLFEVKLDEDVDAGDIEIPPMLLQPVIENAIEHGGPKIVMEISIRDDLLSVDVWDNGAGFEEGAMDKDRSVAIKLLEERIEGVGGKAEFLNATGGGAQVRLVIPV